MTRLQQSEEELQRLVIEIRGEKEIRGRLERGSLELKRRAAELEDNYEKLQQQSRTDQQQADNQMKQYRLKI